MPSSPDLPPAQRTAEETAHLQAVDPEDGSGPHESPTDPELLKQQIKLIQLCFGEDEFGVPFETQSSSFSSSSPSGSALRPFSAKQFVTSKLSHGVSLAVLCKDLDVFVDYVEGEMKRHVNAELHDAFISASGRLVGMEAELQCVQKPLATTMKRVATITTQLDEIERNTQSKMQYACDTEKERLFDTTFLRGLLLYEAMADYLDRIDPLLRVDLPAATPTRPQLGADDGASHAASSVPRGTALSASPQRSLRGPSVGDTSLWGEADGHDITSTAAPLKASTLRHIERLAQTSVQLREVVKLLPPLPHRVSDMEEMQQLANAASDAAASLAQQAFCRACGLFFQHPSPIVTQQLKQIMHIYVNADAEARFVSMFSESVLRPFFDAVLSWKAATQARQSTRDMLRLLNDLYDSITHKLAPLLVLVRRSFQGRLMPVVELLWPALCEGLIKKLVTLYDAAIPEAFHQKYVHAYRLYSLVEGLCGSRQELDALRVSPDVALWNHKWNTDVYMALRQAELQKALEASVQQFTASLAGASCESARSAAIDGYLLAPLRELDARVTWLLSPDVFLFACAPKMLREVVSAVETVLTKTLAAITAEVPAKSPTLITQLLVQLLCDMGHLQHDGTQRWASQLTASAPSNANTMTAVIQMVEHTLLSHFTSTVQTRISQAVVADSAAALENVRSVRLSYSHTKKPAPTQASWYVSDIIKPFDALARNTETWAVPPTVRLAVLQDSANKLLTQFVVIARDTLVTAKKTEDSWEKVRKRKEAVGAAATEADSAAQPAGVRVTPETASDRDKMTMQLLLDVKALVTDLQARGVDTQAGLPSLAEAQALLRRAEWVAGADIPEPTDIEVE